MGRIFLLLLVFLVPDREIPPPKGQQPKPQICGPSNWGEILPHPVHADQWIIKGHETWAASEVHVGEQEWLIVSWVHLPDGRLARGHYQVFPSGKISGYWYFVTENQSQAEILRDGTEMDDDPCRPRPK